MSTKGCTQLTYLLEYQNLELMSKQLSMKDIISWVDTIEREYKQFLKCLQERGVFLIDIINENLVIKKRGQPYNQVNIKKLISTKNLNDLKCRIKKLTKSDTKIIIGIEKKKMKMG